MIIQINKTGVDGKIFSFDFDTIKSAMLNIELMKKDSYTQYIDVIHFERVYNKDDQR